MVTQVPKMLALVALYFLRHPPCVYGYDIRGVYCEGYIIGDLIGRGGAGDVYKISPNTQSDREAVAKISLVDPRTNTLGHEARVLQLLSEKDNYFKQAVGEIHFLKNAGLEIDKDDNKILTEVQYESELRRPTYQILIMGHMGTSLDEKSVQCRGGKIRDQSIFKREIIDLLAVQYLDRIEEIHAADILHMDIKPANTVYQNGQIFLIDFGLSVFWRSDSGYTGEYCEDNRNWDGELRGTPMYMSRGALSGEAPNRKDDLESILITLLDFENILPLRTTKGDVTYIRKISEERKELRRRVCNPTFFMKYGMKYCHFFQRIDEANFSATGVIPKYEFLKELFRNGCFNCFSRGPQSLDDGDWC